MGGDRAAGRQPFDLVDTGWLYRTFAVLLALSGALNVAWLSLADGTVAARGLAGASVVGVGAVIWLVLARPPRRARRFIAITLFCCATVVTVQTALAGPTSSPFALYYIWLTPFSFLLWSPRRAAIYVGAFGLAFAGVLAGHAHPDLEHYVSHDLPALLVGFGGIATVGWIVRAVCVQLVRRHADAERAGHAHQTLARFTRRALADAETDGQLHVRAEEVLSEALGADSVRVDPASGAIEVVREPAELDEDERLLVSGVGSVLALAAARESAEERRLDDAGRDALTGLPGRERFAARLGERAAAGGTLMLLDVDDFGFVNETLGPHAGDAVLAGIAARVAAALPQDVALARVGADELAVFDPDHDGEVAAIQLARRLQAAVEAPLDLDGAMHHATLSIGIVLCTPGRYDDDRAPIRDAHVAQRRARERGRGRYELYDEDAALALELRRRLEQELRRALASGEFRVVFQPVVDLETAAMTGAETLVRWQHPERGLVGPAEFIEVAEQSDLIVPLGDWILREACRQLKAWQVGSTDFDDFRLAVNISGRQLADPGFVPSVRRMLERYEVESRSLVFELTETALADESSQVALAVTELRELGIRLALDDFGTGYASISYVRRFDFDTLKLDRSFVAGMIDSEADCALIKAAISMGSALSMELLAEGVETEEQAAMLRELGCTAAQGFLYSRPVGGGAIRSLMRRGLDVESAGGRLG